MGDAGDVIRIVDTHISCIRIPIGICTADSCRCTADTNADIVKQVYSNEKINKQILLNKEKREYHKGRRDIVFQEPRAQVRVNIVNS